jgi:hypothetical protein
MRSVVSILFKAAALFGLAKYVLPRLVAEHRQPYAAALDPRDPAADPATGPGAVRAAGPQSMRDGETQKWDPVDEAVDESFPASDPPSSLTVH